MDILVIGIAGGSGSGKSTITNILAEKFGDAVTVIKHDDYYKAHDELTYEERCKINYDHPDAFDTWMLCEHLEKLKNGEEVVCPVYDFTVHNRSKETQVIKPSKVLIIDGILVLHDKRLRDLMDIKLYVDTDADVRVLRRIKRDFYERARSLDSVMTQYLSTVKPMHEMYVEPSKKYADIIIPEGGQNIVAMEMLSARVKKHISAE